MDRRTLLKCCAGLAVVACNRTTSAAESVEYSRELYEELLASGEPFLLDFAATW